MILMMRCLGTDVVTAQTDKWHNVEAISDQLKKCGTLSLIARWMDKIAGHIFFDCSDKDKAYLARLYMLPSYQRLGIGEKLLEQTIAINKIQGKIYLKVNSENIKGLSFYQKSGFRVTGQLYEDGRTLLTMEKEI